VQNQDRDRHGKGELLASEMNSHIRGLREMTEVFRIRQNGKGGSHKETKKAYIVRLSFTIPGRLPLLRSYK
jgi:hypothetical protein